VITTFFTWLLLSTSAVASDVEDSATPPPARETLGRLGLLFSSGASSDSPLLFSPSAFLMKSPSPREDEALVNGHAMIEVAGLERTDLARVIFLARFRAAGFRSWSFNFLALLCHISGALLYRCLSPWLARLRPLVVGV